MSRSRFIALPLVMAALAAAGCGGSSKSGHSVTGGAALSATAYHSKVNAALAPWDVAVHSLSAHITPATLQAVSVTASQGARDVAALTPPPAVANLQPKLVGALKLNAVRAAQWAAALKRHDTAAATLFAARFRQEGRAVLQIDSEYRAKGVTL